MKLTAEIRPQTVSVGIRPAALDTGFGAVVARDVVEREPFDGPYELTPSTQPQVLATNGKRMTGDIVINRIPQNYGLITWTGPGIRVS